MSERAWQTGRVETARHTTAYLHAGPPGGTPVIFIHGWPELSLSWRHQIAHLSALGYRTIAPDMRGYGGSSTYQTHADYAQREVVADMLELADALEIERAVWVGHDWGCATAWSLARHHRKRTLAVANFCVPYLTLELGWDGMLPLVDRDLYPQDEYPYGQWDYQKYYEESFAAATSAFDSDPESVVKLLFRKGNPEGQGRVSGTALTRRQGGWFGGATEIPELPRDDDVVSAADAAVYAEALGRNSFFGPDSYYMNHDANAAYAAKTPKRTLDVPVLYVHARYDYVCESVTSDLAVPMREHCPNLTEATLDGGHWIAQERPDEVNAVLAAWLAEAV